MTAKASHPPLNNEFYDSLGERWYLAQDDPVALLRAESAYLTAWIAAEIREVFGAHPQRVLDLGCGAGFYSNALARHGQYVTGVDLSRESLTVAAQHDVTGSVRYLLGDAQRLTFAAESFDVVTAMDLLEHVDDPAALIRESARVLAPGGRLYFHTFNRNLLAWLVVIKGVEWFVKNVPPHMHVLRLFRKPREVLAMCADSGLMLSELRGVRPVLSRAFLRLLATGIVPKDFSFRFTRTTSIGYAGVAIKTAST